MERRALRRMRFAVARGNRRNARAIEAVLFPPLFMAAY
jgi:hypothetical protein